MGERAGAEDDAAPERGLEVPEAVAQVVGGDVLKLLVGLDMGVVEACSACADAEPGERRDPEGVRVRAFQSWYAERWMANSQKPSAVPRSAMWRDSDGAPPAAPSPSSPQTQ